MQNHIRDQIHDKCDDKQHQSDGKQSIIVCGVIGHLTQLDSNSWLSMSVTEWRKPLGKAGAFPVAMSTVMVSPIARPMPSMIAAMIPERAAGIFTRISVCQRLAPSASEASL